MPKEFEIISYEDGSVNLHCLFGPAVTFSDGSRMFFIHGQEFTEEEFWKHPDVKKIAPENRLSVEKILQV